MALKIYSCAEWGAVPPRRAITVVGRPNRIIDHHTAGHSPNLDHKPSDTLEEAKAYARVLQKDHMNRKDEHGNLWIDTGQNFLVSRSGHVLEGRHGSLSAVASGKMVSSAHCLGQNHHPGIEHEHMGEEALTEAQKKASIALHVWICRKTGIKPTEFYPHKQFDATECPSPTVLRWLPELKAAVARELEGDDSVPTAEAFRIWVDWRLGRGAFKGHGRANPTLRPPWLPTRIPRAWWRRLLQIVGRAPS